jgi:hypothetical protein
MNIFVTSSNPIKCAKFLDNKRVVKMCLETAQMLSTALYFHGYNKNDIYKKTHVNHPCTIWARENKSNFKWLLKHFKALCDEYTLRYNKVHKSYRLFNVFNNNINLLPNGAITKFANCAANKNFNLNFKHLSTFDAYRLYLDERFKNDKIPAICNVNYGGNK